MNHLPRVCHIISNLNTGGAETSLCSLVEATNRHFENVVISMIPGGALRPRLERAGAKVLELGGRRGLRGAISIAPCARVLSRVKPDLVQAWMYHANIGATLARELGYVQAPVVWNVRQSADNLDLERRLTRLVVGLNATLSGRPDGIVYNSERGRATHEAIGFANGNSHVIANGIDCGRFKPRPTAGSALRATLGLAADTVLIGRVARYAAMKDFPTLLATFQNVRQTLESAHLVLCGQGMSADNRELLELVQRYDCGHCVHLLGVRLDVEMLYPAFDILVSSSAANEGFPNVVAEGLACGTLVASTLSGDEALIKGGCHAVAAPGDPEALAAGILQLLQLPLETKRKLGAAGRRLIEAHYSIEACAGRYVELYDGLRSGLGSPADGAHSPAMDRALEHSMRRR